MLCPGSGLGLELCSGSWLGLELRARAMPRIRARVRAMYACEHPREHQVYVWCAFVRPP